MSASAAAAAAAAGASGRGLASFLADVRRVLPAGQVATDALACFAASTDASVYRMVPRAVLSLADEAQVRAVLPLAARSGTAVTFRAAGTSLSGQAQTDSVLLKIAHVGRGFRRTEVLDGGARVRVEPAVIGGEVNRTLARHAAATRAARQYKIGPDPSSLDSCMIGGIVANNSSGMCCGVAANAYNTLDDLRVVLVDGTVLDTACPDSRAQFEKTHARLLAELSALAAGVQGNPALAARIRAKYAIKNTTGYSLNALVDAPPDRPIEILKRLMVGSEGTLGFISQVTLRTVVELPAKRSAFVPFATMAAACEATARIREAGSAAAVELFDEVSLRCLASLAPLRAQTPWIAALPPGAAALLIECRADCQDTLEPLAAATIAAIDGRASVPARFAASASEADVYWTARKGLIPIVGGARRAGTSMLIEDVAVPVPKLARMATALSGAFARLGHPDACLFGHALDGNLHIVFTQGFATEPEVARFARVMDALADIVVGQFDGSLKAEHGTGRNVAPFVAREWGPEATDIMWRIKRAFDPTGVLSPGVLMSDDPHAHLRHLKQTPPAHPTVDACIECGFCESVCPSRDIALTPRQRIATVREIVRRGEAGEDARELSVPFQTAGLGLCAADGMCATKCPVGINTGDLVRSLRVDTLPPHSAGARLGSWAGRNFGALAAVAPRALDWAHAVDGMLPSGALAAISRLANQASGRLVPVWGPNMPRGARALPADDSPAAPASDSPNRKPLVYFPSCMHRMMGAGANASSAAPAKSVPEHVLSLARKSGFAVRYTAAPGPALDGLCCGMAFESRGLAKVAQSTGARLEAALAAATDNGRVSVLVDADPCAAFMRKHLSSAQLRAAVTTPLELTAAALDRRAVVAKPGASVHAALHVPCSAKRMGLGPLMHRVAAQLAGCALVDSDVACCGTAGDRGLRFPELPGAALAHLVAAPGGVLYSTSRTCEIPLADAAPAAGATRVAPLVELLDERLEAAPPRL